MNLLLLFIGSKAFCKEQQFKLEELCSTLICNEREETHGNEEESGQVSVANISSSKRKGNSMHHLEYVRAHKISLRKF